MAFERDVKYCLLLSILTSEGIGTFNLPFPEERILRSYKVDV